MIDMFIVYAVFLGALVMGIFGFLIPEILKNYGNEPVTDNRTEPITEPLFNMEGEDWETLRAKLTPMFTMDAMKMMFETLLEKANVLKRVISECADTKQEIKITEVLARFGTDVIGSVVFGIECNSLENEANQLRTLILYIDKLRLDFNSFVLRKGGIGRMALDPSLYKIFMEELFYTKVRGRPGYDRSFPKKVTTYFTEVVMEIIKYREQNNMQGKNFMQLMLQLKNQSDEENSLTDKEIIAQSFVFYMGGFESSTTATFVLLRLAHNHEVQDTLRQEINNVLGKHDGKLTYDAIIEMDYLDKVLHETLRQYPSVSISPRQCDIREEGLRFEMMQTKVALISLLQQFRVSRHKRLTMWPLRRETDAFKLLVEGDVWLKVDRLC